MNLDEWHLFIERVCGAKGLYPGKLSGEERRVWRDVFLRTEALVMDDALTHYFASEKKPKDGPQPSIAAVKRFVDQIKRERREAESRASVPRYESPESFCRNELASKYPKLEAFIRQLTGEALWLVDSRCQINAVARMCKKDDAFTRKWNMNNRAVKGAFSNYQRRRREFFGLPELAWDDRKQIETMDKLVEMIKEHNQMKVEVA